MKHTSRDKSIKNKYESLKTIQHMDTSISRGKPSPWKKTPTVVVLLKFYYVKKLYTPSYKYGYYQMGIVSHEDLRITIH